ncbi:hypothetical protein ES703_59230 [subsurface metagenome]
MAKVAGILTPKPKLTILVLLPETPFIDNGYLPGGVEALVAMVRVVLLFPPGTAVNVLLAEAN